MKNLKRCPFCGGEAEYTKVGNSHIGIKQATVKCTRCFVQRTQKFRNKAFDFEWIDKTMIDSWNRRSDNESEDEKELIEQVYNRGNIKEKKIITLCGSTRFKEYFLEVQKKLSLAGYIVLMPGCFSHAGDHITKEQEKMLSHLHRQKIDISDSIFVINVDGYIGESTLSEINYAEKKKKTILYYSNEDEAGEEPETLQDHEADGAEQGEGGKGDHFENERVFQMVDHVKNDVDLLKQISAGSMWYYSQFDIFRAYKAALNLAADIEKLAKKQRWRLL